MDRQTLSWIAIAVIAAILAPSIAQVTIALVGPFIAALLGIFLISYAVGRLIFARNTPQ